MAAGEIVNLLFAGETAIDGLATHPWDPILASSNVEDVIQLWSPEADGPPQLENLNSILQQNAEVAILHALVVQLLSTLTSTTSSPWLLSSTMYDCLHRDLLLP